MTRFAKIESGVVTSVMMVGESYIKPTGVEIVPSATANVGDLYANGVFSKPVVTRTAAELVGIVKQVAALRIKTLRLRNVGGGVTVLADATPETRIDMAALAQWGADNQSLTRTWIDHNGAHSELTGSQLVTLYSVVNAYVINTYDTAAALQRAVLAVPPTVTNESQIIAAMPWWPDATI